MSRSVEGLASKPWKKAVREHLSGTYCHRHGTRMPDSASTRGSILDNGGPVRQARATLAGHDCHQTHARRRVALTEQVIVRRDASPSRGVEVVGAAIIAAMTPAILPGPVARKLREACERAYPDEACGLVLGHAGDVRDVVAGRNVAIDRRARFELDPESFLGAWREAAMRGLDVIGTWHSHPDGPAAPSRLDEESADPAWLHLVVAVERGRATQVAAWTSRRKTGTGPVFTHRRGA